MTRTSFRFASPSAGASGRVSRAVASTSASAFPSARAARGPVRRGAESLTLAILAILFGAGVSVPAASAALVPRAVFAEKFGYDL